MIVTKKCLHLPAVALFLLLVLVASACKKNEFVVSVALPEDVNEVITTIYYASDPAKGWMTENAVSVHNGHGELKGFTNLPALVFFSLSQSACPVVAYAERGDQIIITGSSADPLGWKIEGNALTRSLTEWRLANKSLLSALSSGAEADVKAVNKAVAKSVKDAPDAPVSVLLLGLYYNRRQDPKGFDSLIKLLRSKKADESLLALVSRADMLDRIEEREFPKQIVVRSFFTGCDTVKFGKVPVMIVFSRPGDKDYAGETHQLRELTRELNDSSRRVIVKMIVDADSLTALSACRRDSLKAAVSAWAPMGVSDNTAVEVGAPRLPWEIVVGKDGKPVYEGSDMSAAVKAMSAAAK